MKLIPLIFLLAFTFPASARTCHTEHQFLAPDITYCSKSIHRHHHIRRKPPAAFPVVSPDSLNAELKRCVDAWEKREARK